MKRAFSATLVAFALMFLPAIVPIPESIAQAPTPAPAPEVRTSKINLTVEQRHVIKEIVKDLPVAKAPADAPITTGSAAPVGRGPAFFPAGNHREGAADQIAQVLRQGRSDRRRQSGRQ